MWRRCLTVMSWRWSEISWEKRGHCLVSSRICKLDSRVEWMILIETYWNHKPTHSANTEKLWDNLGLQKRPSTMRGIVRYWQFKSFVWVPYVKWHTHTHNLQWCPLVAFGCRLFGPTKITAGTTFRMQLFWSPSRGQLQDKRTGWEIIKVLKYRRRHIRHKSIGIQ